MDIMSALRKVTFSIKEWVDDNKVQKVNGKGLSTNDYTMVDKDKVENMPNGLVVSDGKLYLTKDGTPLEDTAVMLPNGDGIGEDMIVFDCGTSTTNL